MAIVLVSLGAIVWAVKSSLGDSLGAAASQERVFICSETLKPFNHELKTGEGVPIYSPASGKQTGYPAELCYWTKEGTIKSTPTPVLLNDWLGNRTPTYCPDCGRLVVAHNPVPQGNAKPPPLKSQSRPG